MFEARQVPGRWWYREFSPSAYEIYDDQMEDQAGDDEISKGSLWADVDEVCFVLGVGLYPKADWKGGEWMLGVL